MKFFVTGVGGQLGHDMVNEIISRKYDVIGSDIFDEISANCDYIKLDITDKNAVFSAIEKAAPDKTNSSYLKPLIFSPRRSIKCYFN